MVSLLRELISPRKDCLHHTPSCYLDVTSKLSERKEQVRFRIGGNHKLRIKTGRYDQIPRVNRLCPIWESNQIKCDSHFLVFFFK